MERYPVATYSITDLFGGELVLGRSMNKGGALAELVREGLPVKALLLLADRLEMRQAEISEKIGIPRRTLTRRLTQHSRLRRKGGCMAENTQPRVARRTTAGSVGYGPGRARG
jgi:uncharacterized protein (DUF2384 family)